MTKKKKRISNDKGFPIDDRPVIFNVKDSIDINYVGRYIENECMFMLSLNDTESDFISEKQINEWWYITEHPIVLEEVLNENFLKKVKINKDKPKYKRKVDDSENKTDSESKTDSNLTSNTQTFSIPRNNHNTQPPLPPFLRDFVKNIEQQVGFNFQEVNVRVLGEDDLSELPKQVLQQILDKAIADENYELATKVSDIINSKK
jgi:hypothetical protein